MNCNHRRCLLGLNPLPDAQENQPNAKKTNKNPGRKTQAKPENISPKEKTTTNHITGLDGNQLHVINNDCSEMLMKLQVSSALHEKNTRAAEQEQSKAPGKSSIKTESPG